jgi:uncharacterized protein YndB with AHSA1/START domain
MSGSLRLVITHQFSAPSETVFDAWLDVESAAQWLFATPGGVMERVEISPRVGGGFEILERRGDVLATHFGSYQEIARPHVLAFSFGVDPMSPPTNVRVEIAGHGAGAELKLTHAGVWPEYEERTRAGWTMILQGLARTLGEGA